MARYLVTYGCIETGAFTSYVAGDEIAKTYLKSDIPTRINSTKTIRYFDSLAGLTNITTITKI